MRLPWGCDSRGRDTDGANREQEPSTGQPLEPRAREAVAGRRAGDFFCAGIPSRQAPNYPESVEP